MNQQMQAYLDKVCQQVKSQEVHEAVRDPYGATLIAATATIFSFRFAWNLLMTAGLLPIAEVDLPFVSYGVQGAAQLVLVGLVLGIFRRKEMIRTVPLPQ